MSGTMKDSGIPWIGDIPSHWKTDNIGNLYSHRNEKVSDKDYPPLSVTKMGVVPQLATAAKTDDGDNRKLVRKGDFAINSRSDRRGSCGISAYDGSVSLINTILTPRAEMNPCYYDWLFHTSVFADEFYKWGHGIVDDLWTTRWAEMKRISIVVPPLSEQEVIADYLNKKCREIDEMLSLQDKINEELKAYKQSVITDVALKGLTSSTQMQDSEIAWIGKIPRQWKERRLKSLGYFYGGLSGKSGDDFNVDEERDRFAMYIPFTNIFNNLYIDVDKLSKVKVEENEKQNCVGKGDLLFLMSSEDYDGVGKPSLLNYDIPNLFLNSFCKGFRITSDEVYPPYLLYLLSSEPIRKIIMNMANGFIRINLRIEKLGTCPVVIPSINEQIAIADYLDKKCSEIDALISLKQSKIEALKEYKKSIIYEYITGKKHVNE